MPGRLQSTGLQRVGHDWATKHIQNDKNLKDQCYYKLMRKWIGWNFHAPPATMQNGAAVLESSLAISQKIKHKLTILSRNSTPRYWLNISGKKNVHTVTCTQVFIAVFFLIKIVCVFRVYNMICYTRTQWNIYHSQPNLCIISPQLNFLHVCKMKALEIYSLIKFSVFK